MRDVGAVLGVVASLCLIAVSAILNYRMGFRAADNARDGMIYGIGAAAGDVLKALAPMMLVLAVRKREWLAVTAAAVVFVTGTAYSFTAALGFAAEHRAVRAAIATAKAEDYRAYVTARDQFVTRLTFLGPQRSVAEIEADVAVLLAQPVWAGGRTVGEVSAGCSISKPATRPRCEMVAQLKAEAAKAGDAAATAKELAALEQTRPVTGGGENAQVLALVALSQHLWPLPEDVVMAGLALLLAIFLEVGSGLGLFLATTPWRAPPMRPTPTSPRGVAEFMAELLEPARNNSVTGDEVLQRYLAWLPRKQQAGIDRQQVLAELVLVAQGLGLRVQGAGAGLTLHHVKLSEDGQGRRG